MDTFVGAIESACKGSFAQTCLPDGLVPACLSILENKFSQSVCEWDCFFKQKLKFKDRMVLSDLAAALEGTSSGAQELTAGMVILTSVSSLEENAMATQCAASPLHSFTKCLALPGFFAVVPSDTEPVNKSATLPAAMILLGFAAPGLQAAASLRQAAAEAMLYEDFAARLNRVAQAGDSQDPAEETNVHDGIKGSADPYLKKLSVLSKALQDVDSFQKDACTKSFLQGKATGGINLKEGTLELMSCGWSEIVLVVDGMRKVLAEFRGKAQVVRSLVSSCWAFDEQVVGPIQKLDNDISKKGTFDIKACGPALTHDAGRASDVSNIFARAHAELRRIKEVFPDLYTDEEVARYQKTRHRLSSAAAFVAAMQVVQAATSGSEETQRQSAAESAMMVQQVVSAKKLTLPVPLMEAIRGIAESGPGDEADANT